MTEVECPMDGCDYTGEPPSVEGHISAMRDAAHKGETGSQHRHLFAPESDTDSEATEGATESSTEEEAPQEAPEYPSVDAGPQSGGGDTTGTDSGEGSVGAVETGGVLGGTMVAAMWDEMGTTQQVTVVVVAVVVLWLYFGGSDSPSGSETATSPADGSAEDEQQQSGGLVQ
jgi:hypothetical protein